MKRPLYETAADLAREAKVAAKITQKWPIEITKQEIEKSHIDYLGFVNESPCIRIEIRCRNYSWDKLNEWGGLFISERKWQEAKKTVNEEKIAFALVVEAKDDIRGWMLYPNEPIPELKIGWGGRSKKNMRDKWDQENVVYIPTDKFEVRF